MTRARRIVCSCCRLEHPVLVDAGGPTPLICAQCAWHRNDSAAAVVHAETEHVRMFRFALLDAQDGAELARDERDFYRDELHRSLADMQLMTAALLLVDERHHYRGDECACGDARCGVVDVLADPKIARLIGTYDEHRHVLRELRTANPGDPAGVWTDIDVTLVYPKVEHDQAVTGPIHIGRHRRAG